MPKEIRCAERTLKELYAPNEILVDQSTARRLEELCSTMTDTCGIVEATLQLAIEEEGKKQVACIRTALNLSARGTKAIKMFLSEWSVLVEESKSRENSGRSARDSTMGEPGLPLVLNSITAPGLTTKSEPQPLAETKRRAVINALQETGGDKEAASRMLGIGRTTLYRNLKEYNPTS
jgi:transcriptional regulator of acetoin/glycerol metabolism